MSYDADTLHVTPARSVKLMAFGKKNASKMTFWPPMWWRFGPFYFPVDSLLCVCHSDRSYVSLLSWCFHLAVNWASIEENRSMDCVEDGTEVHCSWGWSVPPLLVVLGLPRCIFFCVLSPWGLWFNLHLIDSFFELHCLLWLFI